MTATLITRYRLEDLRRLATELTASRGVSPARASALATHLLWFDAAGASSHGIATLPTWLERIEKKEVDPTAQGKAILERSGTAIFDAQQGLPPLALETAAGIASEKARDVGIGIVRVRNLGPTGPSVPVASNLAIGPFAAMIAGPAPSLTLAMPTPDGFPALYDSELVEGVEIADEPTSPPGGWLAPFTPWIATLAGDEGWMIVALSIPALESLSSFHERAASAARAAINARGPLWPETLAARRQDARDHGVPLEPAATAGLKEWAARCQVSWPVGSSVAK